MVAEDDDRVQNLLSIYLPPPASVHVSKKMFVRFKALPGNRERVGHVESINVEERRMTVHNFLGFLICKNITIMVIAIF
jgi:hypothetical protein